MSRRLWLPISVCATVAGALLFLSGGPVEAAPVTVFQSTGTGPAFVVVPTGICNVTITAKGGQGGAAGGPRGATGGSAAVISARVAVTPGQTLNILVASAG